MQMLRLMMFVFMMLLACGFDSQGDSAQSGESSAGSSAATTASTTIDVPTSGETTSGTTASSSTGVFTTSGTTTLGSTSDETTRGGSSGVEESTGGPPCENVQFICADLMKEFPSLSSDDCQPYGDSPLFNLDLVTIAMEHLVDLRYQSCGSKAWDRLLILIDGQPFQEKWKSMKEGDYAGWCDSTELIEALIQLEDVFLYPFPPGQEGQTFSTGDKSKSAYQMRLCGSDDTHFVQTLSIAKQAGGQGNCTDNLSDGDPQINSVLTVQIQGLAPAHPFGDETGVAILLPTDPPLYDKFQGDNTPLEINLQVNLGLAGNFCITPLDDADNLLHVVSDLPAPDHQVM